MFSFKKITSYFSIILLSLTLSTASFANDNMNLVKDQIVDSEIITVPYESVTTSSSKPSLARVDWGSLISKSSFSHSKGSTNFYNNKGNYTTALNEFYRIGGNGRIKEISTANGKTLTKTTSDGTVTLYKSTSSTLGAQRPTLTYSKATDKIRFLGN